VLEKDFSWSQHAQKSGREMIRKVLTIKIFQA